VAEYYQSQGPAIAIRVRANLFLAKIFHESRSQKRWKGFVAF
jgi:hypothetical protein